MPDWTGWSVTARDGCSTTRQRAQQVIDPLTGLLTNQICTVVQVGTGLNFQDASGAWQESRGAMALTADGGAAATEGPLKLQLSPAGLNDDDALTVTMPSGRVLSARVLGVYLYDSQSGQSRLLAAPSSSAVAEQLSPNQVIYRSAFNSDTLWADLRYTYTPAGFESDVIITRQPKLSPQDAGFNPDTTLLQVRHQWRNAPAPRRLAQITVGQGTEAEIPDQIIDLGELLFPCGRAFLTDGGGSAGTNAPARITIVHPGGADLPVGKEWQPGAGPGGSSLLLESVAWYGIAPQLAQLPLIAKADGAAPRTAVAQGLPRASSTALHRSIQLCAARGNARGVVVDYTAIVSTSANVTFNTYVPGQGPTYLVVASGSGYANLSGAVTFQPGCVVKFEYGATLMLSGSVVCNGSQGSPSVLTSQRDLVYGDPLGGQFASVGDVNIAVDLYYPVQGSIALNGLLVRYATTAIECVAACGPMQSASVNNCGLFDCGTGVDTVNMNVTIQNSSICQVTTPISVAGGCYNTVTGGFTQTSAPAFTLSPSSQCQFVLPTFSSVSFSAAATPAPCTYTWVLNQGLVGTGPSVTLGPSQLGTSYGGQKLWVYATDPSGANTSSDGGWVGVVDNSAMAVANHWITYTNGKTIWLWQTYSTSPPALAWYPNCMLYGKTGFTAISQLNDWQGVRGQMPVTALTARHGYMRGHGSYPTYPEWYAGFNTGCNGQNVYFCTANNTLVTATVAGGFTRCCTTNLACGSYDYTILIFSADLPASIQPMQVSYTWPTYCSVIFNTAQAGYISANNPPFSVYGGCERPYCSADSDAFVPFNYLQTWNGGDSGSPIMLPATDDVLVFLQGETTSPPSAQMQADMDTLSTSLGLNPANYQMVQHSVQ